MTAISNRYDFVLLFDVQDGNPNGAKDLVNATTSHLEQLNPSPSPQPPPPPTDSIRDANPAETADPAADPAVADVYALATGDANTLPFASRPVPVPAPDRRISSANISTSGGICSSSRSGK